MVVLIRYARTLSLELLSSMLALGPNLVHQSSQLYQDWSLYVFTHHSEIKVSGWHSDRGVGLLAMSFPDVFPPFCWSNFTRNESSGCRWGRGRNPCLLSKYWRYAVLYWFIDTHNFAGSPHRTKMSLSLLITASLVVLDRYWTWKLFLEILNNSRWLLGTASLDVRTGLQ